MVQVIATGTTAAFVGIVPSVLLDVNQLALVIVMITNMQHVATENPLSTSRSHGLSWPHKLTEACQLVNCFRPCVRIGRFCKPARQPCHKLSPVYNA